MFVRAVLGVMCLPLMAMTVVHAATTQQHMSVDVPCTTKMQLSVGEKRYIKVYENPSTGYQWTASQTNELFKVEDYRERPTTHLPVVGAGLQRTWIFEAVKSGHTTLTMTHGRSWEKQPLQTWQCDIEVVAAP